MKKYIQRIAKDAGFILWGKEPWNPGDVVDWSSRYDKELENFTELLLMECVKQIETVAVQFHLEEGTYSAGKKAGALECEKAIKKHFGVK